MQNRQQAARSLGWVGVAPFVGLVIISGLGAPGWLSDLLLGYALVILAFMCGSLWAGAMARPADSPIPLFASNVLVLAGLGALLMPLSYALGWLALLFAGHGLAEWRWVHHGQPGWYRRLRIGLSCSVVGLLVVAALIGFADA